MHRLKDVREDYDFTQTEIAKILNTQQTQYSRYEKGKQMMGLDKWIKLALFYNISLDYLVGISDHPRTLTGISYWDNRQIIIKQHKINRAGK